MIFQSEVFRSISKQRTKVIFITWAKFQRRPYVLSEQLGAVPYFLGMRRKYRIFRPFEYFLKTLQTWWIVWRNKPKIVFASNPPIFCPLAIHMCSFLTRISLVIDSHNSAIVGWWVRLPFSTLIMNSALVNIVHNDAIKEIAEKANIKSIIVIEDKIPEFTSIKKIKLEGRFNIAVISSAFTSVSDEPMEEIIKAAEIFSEAHFYISGSPAEAKKYKFPPNNITFTGFLNDRDYINLLCSVDAIVALTLRDKTQLAAASEAIGAGKPLITSNFQVLREMFPKGVIFVNGDYRSILGGFKEAKDNIVQLQKEIPILREERAVKWRKQFQKLMLSIQAGKHYEEKK